MTAQGEPTGFCFHCAALGSRFPPSSAIPLENSWPLLAQSNNLDIAVSQPLIRAFYFPTPIADILSRRENRLTSKPRSENQDDFLDCFIWMHEEAHLTFLDWTPAKDLAKLLLSLCYDILRRIVFRQSMEEGARRSSFARVTKRLG